MPYHPLNATLQQNRERQGNRPAVGVEDSFKSGSIRQA